MKIAICEDEIVFSSQIKNEVTNFFAAKNIAVDIDVFTDGHELLNRSGYDIIFMDINLENSDGMETASRIRELDKKALLVFVTSVENRAVEGYDVDAFGYIVKNKVEEKLPLLLDRLWNELHKERILVVKDNNKTCFLLMNDILAVESSGRGIIIYTFDSEFKTSEKIGQFSEKLPTDIFVECHKSVFVNADKIKSIDVNFLTVTSGKTFPVSRRCRKEVMAVLMERVRRAGEI